MAIRLNQESRSAAAGRATCAEHGGLGLVRLAPGRAWERAGPRIGVGAEGSVRARSRGKGYCCEPRFGLGLGPELGGAAHRHFLAVEAAR